MFYFILFCRIIITITHSVSPSPLSPALSASSSLLASPSLNGDDSEEKETPIAVDVDEKQEIIVPTGDVHTPHVESTTTTTTTTAPTSKWTAESTTTTKKQQQQQQHHRTFFHFSEVVGAVLLRAGDEVAFIMHTSECERAHSLQRALLLLLFTL